MKLVGLFILLAPLMSSALPVPTPRPVPILNIEASCSTYLKGRIQNNYPELIDIISQPTNQTVVSVVLDSLLAYRQSYEGTGVQASSGSVVDNSCSNQISMTVNSQFPDLKELLLVGAGKENSQFIQFLLSELSYARTQVNSLTYQNSQLRDENYRLKQRADIEHDKIFSCTATFTDYGSRITGIGTGDGSSMEQARGKAIEKCRDDMEAIYKKQYGERGANTSGCATPKNISCS